MNGALDPREALALFSHTFDTHPVAAVVLDEAGRVLYLNRLCRHLLPSLRRRMVFSRHLDGEVPAFGALSCLSRAGESFLACAEKVRFCDGVRLLFLQRLQEGFSEEFSALLSEYQSDLFEQTLRALSEAQNARQTEKQRYLSELFKQTEVLSRLHDLSASLGEVRNLAPGKVLAVSAGELVRFFAARTAPVLSEAGLELVVRSESGIVALLNFHDFTRAMLHAINFFSVFVLSRTLHLELSGAGEGECVFDLWGEDRHRVLSLYRLFCRRGLSARAKQRESALFFPLFCALSYLRQYAHRVDLSHEGDALHLRIRVRTTLEFPALVVREDEGFFASALEFSRQAERALYPEALRAYLLRNLPESEELSDVELIRITEVRLFDRQ